MNEQYDAWLKSGHRHAATCVECHLPAAGLAKWLAKADHGFRHSVAFTLQNFKEPIEITPHDRGITQANCLRCHGDFVHAVYRRPGSLHHELECTHCHAGAGHAAGGGWSTITKGKRNVTESPGARPTMAAHRPCLRSRGRSHHSAAGPPYQHLRAQAGSASALRPRGRGDGGDGGPEAVGTELALRV